MENGKKEKKQKTLAREILEWALTIVAAVAIALPVRAFGDVNRALRPGTHWFGWTANQ